MVALHLYEMGKGIIKNRCCYMLENAVVKWIKVKKSAIYEGTLFFKLLTVIPFKYILSHRDFRLLATTKL